jgi:hypothetical protein
VTASIGQTSEAIWSTGTAKVTMNEVKWIDDATDASQAGVFWPAQQGAMLALNVTYEVSSGSVPHNIDNWSAGYDDPTTPGLDYWSAIPAASLNKGLPDYATFGAGEKHTGLVLFDVPHHTVDVRVDDGRNQLITWSIPG